MSKTAMILDECKVSRIDLNYGLPILEPILLCTRYVNGNLPIDAFKPLLKLVLAQTNNKYPYDTAQGLKQSRDILNRMINYN